MSREAPIGPTIGTMVVSTEGNVIEKEEVSVASKASIKGFFDDADVIAEAMAFATVATTRKVSIEA